MLWSNEWGLAVVFPRKKMPFCSSNFRSKTFRRWFGFSVTWTWLFWPENGCSPIVAPLSLRFFGDVGPLVHVVGTPRSSRTPPPCGVGLLRAEGNWHCGPKTINRLLLKYQTDPNSCIGSHLSLLHSVAFTSILAQVYQILLVSGKCCQILADSGRIKSDFCFLEAPKPLCWKPRRVACPRRFNLRSGHWFSANQRGCCRN